MYQQIPTHIDHFTTDEILTAGLLVVAFVQAILFIFQLWLMRGSLKATQGTVELMKDNAHHQLRAYIDIDSAWIEFPNPATPKATVIIKNTGHTPARDIQHWIHQWVETYPLEMSLPTPPDNFEMATSTLGSNSTHEMVIEAPHPMVKPCLFDKIGSQEATIYVYGSIEYKDIFGKAHKTTYRLMYGGPDGAHEGRLRPCISGNEIT